MEIRAKLVEKFDAVEISATFKKREFVIEYAENPQYPEYLKFELIQDRCDLLNQFETGQQLEVHFNLKGRKWVNPKGETVYFNSLQAWKLVSLSDQPTQEATAPEVSTPPVQETPPTEAYEGDELPF